MKKLSVNRILSLLVTGIVGIILLNGSSCTPNVTTSPSVDKWNVYPDVIFPNNCIVHADYKVVGGEDNTDVRLVLEKAGTGETVNTWHVGRTFNDGFEGNTPALNNGQPGAYLLKLNVNGTTLQQHTIFILRPSGDSVPVTITYTWPRDLMSGSLLKAYIELTNARLTAIPRALKEGETLPIVFCTKYMRIKSITYVGANAGTFLPGDEITLSINGTRLATFNGYGQTQVFSTPIRIRDNGAIMQLTHYKSGGFQFMQGQPYMYNFKYEFIE